MKKRCPGSRAELALQGLQIASRAAPCPECGKVIQLEIIDMPRRRGRLKIHMLEVPDLGPYEYATTISTYRTSGRDYEGEHHDASVTPPEPPADDGKGPWEFCAPCAAEGLIFHTWKRRLSAPTPGDQ